MIEDEFYTFREYMKAEGNDLSASMEDYLEMIYRLSQGSGYTRVHGLADALNVQPPSVTKMLQKLAELELVDYKKYDIIRMTKKGQRIGKSLLNRHNTIESFLKIIGVTENLLEETEKIEHTISLPTFKQICLLVKFLEKNSRIVEEFREFQSSGVEK